MSPTQQEIAAWPTLLMSHSVTDAHTTICTRSLVQDTMQNPSNLQLITWPQTTKAILELSVCGATLYGSIVLE